MTLLDRALALLPPETRDALVARYVDGLVPLEIASRSGVSADAVSMRLLRGRTRLRRLLEDELADDPAARIWVGRHGAAWRATRLRCPQCGLDGVEHRRDRRRGVLELRCARCGPGGERRLRARQPHVRADPRLAQPPECGGRQDVGLVGGVLAGRRPRRRRVHPLLGAGRRHDLPPPGAVRPGRCPRLARALPPCGEEQTTSLAGAALLRPETRALRERRPAARSVPAYAQDRDGHEVVVVGFRDDASGDGVDVVFSAGPDARLLAVATG